MTSVSYVLFIDVIEASGMGYKCLLTYSISVLARMLFFSGGGVELISYLMNTAKHSACHTVGANLLVLNGLIKACSFSEAQLPGQKCNCFCWIILIKHQVEMPGT